MIKKVGNYWVVGSKEGKYLGTYATKQEAERRLQQIEYFKQLHDNATHRKDK
jgi:hypothetical protein